MSRINSLPLSSRVLAAPQSPATGLPLFMNPERLSHYYRPERAAMLSIPQPTQGSLDEYLARHEPIVPEMIGSTAVIRIAGMIEYKLSWYGLLFGATSTRAVDLAFQQCIDNPDVERIVLQLDTTGGDPTGVAECAKRIFDQRGEKPSVALVDPYCASAGLWFAAACGKVVALQSAWIGWMGTMVVVESYAEMLKMAGIDQRAICSPEKKAEWHPANPISEDYQAHLQAMCDELTKQFTSTVAKYRGVSVSHASENFGQGRGLRAPAAKEVGLVDELTTYAPAILTGSKRRASNKAATRADGGVAVEMLRRCV